MTLVFSVHKCSIFIKLKKHIRLEIISALPFQYSITIDKIFCSWRKADKDMNNFEDEINLSIYLQKKNVNFFFFLGREINTY